MERGLAPPAWRAAFERLAAPTSSLARRSRPRVCTAICWSGNLHRDQRGAPCLIDPAVYGGHREVDLAMLELFGSPGARFFAAYEEAYPLSAGRAERAALYQLYPLLAHVNLFGGSYVSSVERALRRYERPR